MCTHLLRAEENFQELVLSFHLFSPRDCTQVIRLRGNGPHLLNCPASTPPTSILSQFSLEYTMAKSVYTNEILDFFLKKKKIVLENISIFLLVLLLGNIS